MPERASDKYICMKKMFSFQHRFKWQRSGCYGANSSKYFRKETKKKTRKKTFGEAVVPKKVRTWVSIRLQKSSSNDRSPFPGTFEHWWRGCWKTKYANGRHHKRRYEKYFFTILTLSCICHIKYSRDFPLLAKTRPIFQFLKT